MASRRVNYSSELVDAVASMDGRRLWETQDPGSYISYLCDDPSITGLCWREVRRMIRWACSPKRGSANQLTEQQVFVLECYLLGSSDAEIGDRLGTTRQAVRKLRLKALAKIKRYKPSERGLLTVMIETFDWPAVREHLADMFEEHAARM